VDFSGTCRLWAKNLGLLTLKPEMVDPLITDLADILCRGCRVKFDYFDLKIQSVQLLDKASRERFQVWMRFIGSSATTLAGGAQPILLFSSKLYFSEILG